MDSSFEPNKKIFLYLRKTNCCLRCCLRFTGSRTPDHYRYPIANTKKYFEEDENEITDNQPCTSCLGLLQNDILDLAVANITKEITSSNCDCNTFSCALTIPIAVQIRERSLQIYLTQIFQSSTNNSVVSWLRIPGVKDVWKWLVNPRIEYAVKKIADPPQVVSPYVIDVIFSHPQDDEECKELMNYGNQSTNGNNRKRKRDNVRCSRKLVENILESINDGDLVKYFPVPPLQPTTFNNISYINCTHAGIYIGGRYAKLSRKLCQTPWFVNGEHKMGTSVQQLLCDFIVDYCKADSMKFLSSGREDVDVRMLHAGRPFAVELVNPKVTKISEEALQILHKKINDSTTDVQLTSCLKVVTKENLKTLKEGENEKTKTYQALCIYKIVPDIEILFEKLNQITNLQIIQKTPMRVLHRRPLCPRERTIFNIKSRPVKLEELKNFTESITLEEGYGLFIVDLETQAGTYVKEFVHGDFGRTKTNLCELLRTEVDIVALDVTGINLNWP